MKKIKGPKWVRDCLPVSKGDLDEKFEELKELIIMTRQEVEAKLAAQTASVTQLRDDVTAQLDKAHTEITAKIEELKKQIEDGAVAESIVEKLNELETAIGGSSAQIKERVQRQDDVVPDAPPPA